VPQLAELAGVLEKVRAGDGLEDRLALLQVSVVHAR
jgi:hypothetical protein